MKRKQSTFLEKLLIYYSHFTLLFSAISLAIANYDYYLENIQNIQQRKESTNRMVKRKMLMNIVDDRMEEYAN